MTQDKLLQLSPDEQAVALRHLAALLDAAHYLQNQIREGQLTEDMCASLLGLCEFSLVDVCKVLGYKADLAADLEQRHGEIRAANIRIRELEQQLGSSRTTDGLKELMQRLRENVCRWWKQDGFGHVHDFSLEGYGACKVELSCMLFGPDDRHGDTPVTARQRYVEWLAALPYDLYQDPREHEPDILDTPRNRTLLVELITHRFPSARITAWRNRPANRQGNDSWELFQIDVYVHDLSDLEEPEASGESSG